MKLFKNHTFHIPVLGVGYSVDTPIKVAPLGISSVISLVDDSTIERMREFYSQKFDIPFKKITRDVEDFRAKRITSYLNVVDEIVQRKVAELKNSVSEAGGEFEKYLQLLPDATEIRKKLNLAQKSREAADELRKWVDSKLNDT